MSTRASLTLSLAALRTFETVVRRGGLTAASQELASTVSAISHQLRGLEASFGQPLLIRQGRAVVATDLGSRLARDLNRAFTEIDLAVTVAQGSRPLLTVSVQASFAARWLIPRLHRFETSAPAIDLRLSTSTRLVDLARERVDCAIRLGPGNWPGVIATLLMPHTEAPIVRSNFRNLAQAPRVVLDGRADEWDVWRDVRTGRGVRMFSTRELVVDAVLAGVGVGILDTVVVAAELARGEVRALASPRASDWNYYCVTAAGEPMSAPVDSFTQWLMKEARQSERIIVE